MFWKNGDSPVLKTKNLKQSAPKKPDNKKKKKKTGVIQKHTTKASTNQNQSTEQNKTKTQVGGKTPQESRKKRHRINGNKTD